MNYKNLQSEFSDYSKLVELIDELENMLTGADIQTGIVTKAKSVELLKQAKTVADQANNVEIKEIIADLRDKLVDTKSLLIDTKEELNNLKSENQQLKTKINKLESPEWQLEFDEDRHAYYRIGDSNKKVPYCPNCWDNKQLKSIFSGRQTKPTCPNCHSINLKIRRSPYTKKVIDGLHNLDL